MPMPHRTFAQVAKRRLVGKEGKERIREVRELLAELPDYKNGPYADLRKWLLAEIEDTRVRSNAVHRDSIAVRREGAAQVALVGPPNVGQVVAPPGAVRDPDQDRRLPVHHAPPGPGTHPDRRRPRPARRDPRADRGRVRGPRRWPGPARGPALGRCDRLLRPAGRRPGRAGGRPRRGRRIRDREAGRSSRRPAPTRPTPRRSRDSWRPSRTSRSSRSRCSTRRRSRPSVRPSGP